MTLCPCDEILPLATEPTTTTTTSEKIFVKNDDISYLCGRMGFVPSMTYRMKRSVMLILKFGNVGNFQIKYKRWHSGSHAIAWAAITVSVFKVSYDLQTEDAAKQCHASCI